ncbi:hypothetical protein [Amycolatopsis sp. SID8362]|uniref:hypothetical protein n=1 Tax=Amycolatopsis sp. SID8362 TaxID=2690346 RepID=UPI00136ED427|nr:hypothetical protein [Amycolatopsis sp. SID8362]NBH08721.1 hypothetical protein [Amycolatopsis sp. SID8362]NED45415.1 hypothetical protein [Amycolatopsis sp. SID8362]
MAQRWGWSEFVAAGPYRGEIITYPDSFETPALPRRSRQPDGDARRTRPAPPTYAWFVFPVPDGVSTGQAASFYLADHEQELWRRLLGTRRNSASGDNGCAVVALAAMTALAAAWARAKWGA